MKSHITFDCHFPLAITIIGPFCFTIRFFYGLCKEDQMFHGYVCSDNGSAHISNVRPCSRAIGNVREVARLLSKYMRLGEKSLVFFLPTKENGIKRLFEIFWVAIAETEFCGEFDETHAMDVFMW